MSLVKRTGIITIITIVVAVAALLVYNYAYLVYQDYDYHTSYEDVHGLQRSSPVLINGVRVGEVTGVKLNKEKNRVDVVLSIKKEIPIPKGSVALIAANNMIDTRMIYLQTSNSTEILKHNDKITGKYDTTVLEMEDQISPLIDGAKYILETAEKNFDNFNRKLEKGLVKETQENIESMEKDMKSFRKEVNSISNSANSVLVSLNQLKEQSASIAAKKNELNTSINSTVASTDTLAAIPIASKVSDIKKAVDTASMQVNTVVNNSALKQLTEDNSTYKNATEKIGEANTNMKELKEDPPGISIFGGN